ncbi:MAG TPA: glycosyltransferase family 39 protein, partial [Bacteroidia bacterium]|nr:glycosyltransferase family 39 protein [Bacteroidia bacterium]
AAFAKVEHARPMLSLGNAFSDGELVEFVGGGGIFPIRAAAAILGTASVWLLFGLGKDLFDARTAWIALLLALAAPANSVLSFFLTIDAPLVFCWSTALWMLWRIVSGSAGWGTYLLLFLSLAIGHLCKQMMMVFPLLAVLFLASSADTRGQLRRVPLWATLLGSYLALLPPLIWNARHGWITFQHTSHHFETRSGGGNPILERLEDFLSFLGTQFGVLSPGTAFVLFSLVCWGLPRLGSAGRPVRYLLVFGVLPVGAMLLLALRQEMQPNWPAVYYVSGILLVAAWYAGHIPARFPPASWRRLFPVTLAMGFGLCAYFYAAPVVFEMMGKAGHNADPNRRMLGYEHLAEQFQSIRETIPSYREAEILVVAHRDIASQLAFALPDQPRVRNFDTKLGIDSQYELWNLVQKDQLIGRDMILLYPQTDQLPAQFAEAFASVEKVADFTVQLQARDASFSVFAGRRLQRWFE